MSCMASSSVAESTLVLEVRCFFFIACSSDGDDPNPLLPVITARGSAGLFSSSQPEEHSESFPHVGKDLNGGGHGEFHAPSVPIQVLNVIRQDAC